MKTRHLISLLFAAPLGAFTLSACDTTTSLTELRHALPESDPYRIALSGMYRDFAEAELAAYDWWSSKRFADKGLIVAKGGDVPPEDPRDWAISYSQREELITARKQLIAVLASGAPSTQPQIAASALFHYDCWVENADEGWQEADITSCRDRFAQNLATLQGATTSATPEPTEAIIEAEAETIAESAPLPGSSAPIPLAAASPPTDSTDQPSLTPTPTAENAPEPALPEIASSMLLYFPFDEAVLESQLLPQVEGLIASLKANPDTQLIINGHADRAGTDDYNLTLSAQRADYMRNILIENGISPDRVTYYAFGESDPAVATPDGVRLRANRRVEIFIE